MRMMDDQLGVEKRACKRFIVPDAKVRYKKPGLLLLLRGFSEPMPVRNLSKGGLSFECDETFPHDQEMTFQLLVPMETPVEIRGQKKWHRACQSGNYRYDIGIQFSPFGSRRGFNTREALDRLRALDKMYADQPPQMRQAQT
jgi:hypothetical protein